MRIEPYQVLGLFLQGIHHLVVALGDVAHLGVGFHRHPRPQVLGAGVLIHHRKQIIEFGFRLVFRHVQPENLILGRDPQGPATIRDPQDEIGDPKRPGKAHANAQGLHRELTGAIVPGAQQRQIAEDAHGDRAPCPRKTVDRHRPHRIINPSPFQPPVAIEHQHRPDRPDHGRLWRRHRMTTGRNRHQPGQGTIDQRFHVG